MLRERKTFIEKKGKIILQTGYGPSGLPHIGTFGEVARTSMIVNALKYLTDLPTEIITFSDDMDGLRKVPDNVPNKELLEKNLHKPLTNVPDPFGKFNSKKPMTPLIKSKHIESIFGSPTLNANVAIAPSIVILWKPEKPFNPSITFTALIIPTMAKAVNDSAIGNVLRKLFKGKKK